MHGADYGQSGGTAQQSAYHVGAGTMTVNNLIAAFLDIGSQLTAEAGNVVSAHDFGGDAHAAGFLGKRTVAETDHLGSNRLIQILQQTQNMGLGTAGVAAAD